jgi:anti-sigma regulatory factor (Ser/Thr protein kinase)
MIRIAQAQFQADYSQLEPIRCFVEQYAHELGIAAQAVCDLTWCITEIVTNVIEHGYEEKPGMVEVVLARRNRDFIMQISDQAPPFDPNTCPEPDLTLPLEQRPLGGLGVYMTKKMMDVFDYQLTENGSNQTTLIKRNAIPRL